MSLQASVTATALLVLVSASCGKDDDSDPPSPPDSGGRSATGGSAQGGRGGTPNTGTGGTIGTGGMTGTGGTTGTGGAPRTGGMAGTAGSASACQERGEACTQATATTPNDCCEGTCVESQNPAYAGCRPTCTSNDECDTDCCVLFSNSTNGFCTSAEFCTCGEVGVTCGPTSPACCEETLCAGVTGEASSCRQVCSSDADCPDTLCLPLSDGSASICDETCAALDEACGPDNLNCCSGLTCAGSESAGYLCYTSCEDPSDCPSGDCQLLANGMSGICVE